MKSIIILLMLVTSTFTTFAKDRITNQISELPENSREFIGKYYNDKEISHIKIDGILIWKEYEVIFTDGVDIEFNSSGDWKEIASSLYGASSGWHHTNCIFTSLSSVQSQ